MVKSNSADCVLCVALLLHCKYPHKVIAEIHRILKPGGMVYLSVPFIFPTCEDPHDYHRFTVNGLDILCNAFNKVDGGFYRGPASTMCLLLAEYLAILFCFGQEWLYTLSRYCFLWLLWPTKYLDVVVSRYPRARMLYSAAFFLGRK
jgi:SAM-dependent methyltransferase